MIDIDNLEKFINDGVAQGERFSLRKDGWIELLTRLRQAEKDAARYRWLKGQQWFADEAEWFMPLNTDADNYEFSQSFDSAIDEAMQCK